MAGGRELQDVLTQPSRLLWAVVCAHCHLSATITQSFLGRLKQPSPPLDILQSIRIYTILWIDSGPEVILNLSRSCLK